MSYIYKQGSIPIILLSLHGGGEKLDCKKRTNTRDGKQFVVSNDSYTKEITMKTYKHMLSKGIQPYLLVNNIHRKYVDLNRFMQSACNDNCDGCMLQYVLFHDVLMKTVLNIIEKYGKCFIFDIHGNKYTTDIIEFGYGLTLDQLKNNDLKTSSLYSFKNKSNLADYIYKNKSLSYFYKKYFTNVFPTTNVIDDSYLKKTNSRYYSGKQFIIKKYSDICDVCLVELSPELRTETKQTGVYLAEGLIKYYNTVYSKL
tara:strand:- start:1875 stop:2642 length:768 start_codon:yes stop_codon:yes gene_type:complete